MSLPPKTVCLTFDDGPGIPVATSAPNTLKIAEYLAAKGIKATFFVVGRHICDHPNILPRLTALKHTIGNHTFDHPDLNAYHRSGGDIARQVLLTDALLSNVVEAGPVFFRPPYGVWSKKLADILNRNLLTFLRYIGPINWDVDTKDWLFWTQNRSPEDCCRTCLESLSSKQKGILIFHDSIADSHLAKRLNRTLSLIEMLVPSLERLGYEFTSLDKVPEVQRASAAQAFVALKAVGNQYLSVERSASGGIHGVAEKTAGCKFESMLGLGGRVSFRGMNELFLTAQPLQELCSTICANGLIPQFFDIINVDDARVAFRSEEGFYWKFDPVTSKLTSDRNRQLGDLNLFVAEHLEPSPVRTGH